MNFLWFVAITLANVLIAEIERRIQAGDNNEVALAVLGAIRSAIQESTANVLQFIREQRFDELAGRVDGLFTTFTRYTEDPQNNHDRLVRMIDTLDQLIGEMNRTLARIDSDEILALNIFSPYTAAVALSAVAVTERRERFGVQESSAGILDQAQSNSARIRNVLRKMSDARFHITFQNEEPGFVAVGFTFDGTFERLAIVPARGNPRRVIDDVNAAMARRQEQEFANFTGVRELDAFTAQLASAIAVDRFRHAALASQRQELLQPIVEVSVVGGAVRRFELS